MARDRQRAKQRQQARREQRLAQRRAEGTRPADEEGKLEEPADDVAAAPEADAPTQTEAEARAAERRAEELADLEAGAPRQDLGTSEATLESEATIPDVEADPHHLEEEEIAEEEEFEDEHPDEFLDEEHPKPGRHQRGHPDHGRQREHGKVIGFLVNVWAELQRVQWPDRQAVTTLTGVVLGFVLIAGGYLGLLDAVFSRVIKAIL